MIDKSRKAVIRDVAIKTRKQSVRALFELGETYDKPMTFLMDRKEKVIEEVCHNEEEIEYFEVCYLHGSQKAAEEFELWNQGFCASYERKEKYSGYDA